MEAAPPDTVSLISSGIITRQWSTPSLCTRCQVPPVVQSSNAKPGAVYRYENVLLGLKLSSRSRVENTRALSAAMPAVISRIVSGTGTVGGNKLAKVLHSDVSEGWQIKGGECYQQK